MTRSAGYLSAGQRRRLSIARLIAVKRPIWLLDEPTSTLDAGAQRRLAEFMRTHLNEGGLVLAATHSALGLGSVQELSLDRSVRSELHSDVAGMEQPAAAAPLVRNESVMSSK